MAESRISKLNFIEQNPYKLLVTTHILFIKSWYILMNDDASQNVFMHGFICVSSKGVTCFDFMAELQKVARLWNQFEVKLMEFSCTVA